MAAGKLLTRALSFLSHQSYPLSRLRRLSSAAAADAEAGDLNPSPDGPVSVLHFLRDRRVGDDVIAAFAPRQLDSKVGKDLPAKFDLFLALGFSVPEAAKFMRCNKLLGGFSLSTLERRLQILRAIVSSDADLRRIFNRSLWTLGSSPKVQRMVDNVSKLRGWGVSESKIRTLLVCHPRIFQMKPQFIDKAADRAVAEFGCRRESKLFTDAVCVLLGTRESNRESKFGVLESFGWERSHITALFVNFPKCIVIAKPTLIKKLDFLMNKVGFDPSFISKNPAVLSFSLEKRVRPRFELLSALKSKNLLPKRQSFYSSWCMSEADFMEKYVVKFMKEEPTICNAYINTVASPKQLASSCVDESPPF